MCISPLRILESHTSKYCTIASLAEGVEPEQKEIQGKKHLVCTWLMEKKKIGSIDWC